MSRRPDREPCQVSVRDVTASDVTVSGAGRFLWWREVQSQCYDAPAEVVDRLVARVIDLLLPAGPVKPDRTDSSERSGLRAAGRSAINPAQPGSRERNRCRGY